MLPVSVWISGFFNPQSFLTAVMQSTARKNELPLDRMCLVCEVTKKYNKEEFSSGPREGAYIHGLYMEVEDTKIFCLNFHIFTFFLSREPGGTSTRESLWSPS